LLPKDQLERLIVKEIKEANQWTKPKQEQNSLTLPKAYCWGVVEGSKIHWEYNITKVNIQTVGGWSKKIIADYELIYIGIKLAEVGASSLTQAESAPQNQNNVSAKTAVKFHNP
jgi:hypothetical protein